MKILYWIILAAIVIGLGSCVTSKSLAKKANAMESGQNYEAAADLFFQSVHRCKKILKMLRPFLV